MTILKVNHLTTYAYPIHGDDRDIPAVLIEIRNDLIAEAADIDEWARHLAAALNEVMIESGYFLD